MPTSPGTPPALPAPSGRRFGWRFKLLALLAVAGTSIGLGAFALPSVEPPATPGTPEGGGPEVVWKPAGEDAKPEPAKPVAPPATTTPAEDSKPVKGASPFDLPRVQPQVPPGKGRELATLIDKGIDAELGKKAVPPSPLAGDAEFLRRAFLDLTGKIPTRDRTVAFLDSTDPTKRARLIDELLDSKEYGRHFANVWADALVKRDFDSNKGLRTEPFAGWLSEQFNENKGWGVVVREMINATGAAANTPATFFIQANEDNGQPSAAKLTGAVGNLFMGIQVHCAECHQHPHTAQWGMDDFWGMAAFFGHLRKQGGGKKGGGGPIAFEEVERFAPAGKKAKGRPIQPGLVIGIPDPTDPRKTVRTARGKFFESKQAVPPAPKLPYRPLLADWLVAKDNPYFAKATVNRLWAHFFARGLVNPVEDMNPENLASHPEVLSGLASAFTASDYDLKGLIRGIMNSRAYNRTSRPLPSNREDDKLYSRMPVRVLGARELLDSLSVATGAARPKGGGMLPKGKKGGLGSDPLVRFFDTREYDDDPTEFSYGIPQILKLMNSQLTSSSQAVAARLAKKGGPDVVLDEIYLTALSRRPTEAERQKMKSVVARRQDPVQGYALVFWALLNSAEFISNR